MKVEVTFALPHVQRSSEIELPASATVADALAAASHSGFLSEVEGQPDVWSGAVGVFGEVVDRSRLLKHGDRVELYRPLEVDPKQARRRRAQVKRPS